MDALASRGERGMKRTAKSRGPGTPTLVSSFAGGDVGPPGPTRRDPRGDGGYQAGTPGRARISRKAIVQGMPGVSAYLW